MTKNGNDEIKRKAGALAESEGIRCPDALRRLQAEQPTGHRYVLTPDLEGLLRGEGLRGVEYDLPAWLADLPPRASCYRVRIRHTLHA